MASCCTGLDGAVLTSMTSSLEFILLPHPQLPPPTASPPRPSSCASNSQACSLLRLRHLLPLPASPRPFCSLPLFNTRAQAKGAPLRDVPMLCSILSPSLLQTAPHLLKSLCLSLGCCYKVPLTRWLRNNRNIFLTVLEAGSPKTRVGF